MLWFSQRSYSIYSRLAKGNLWSKGFKEVCLWLSEGALVFGAIGLYDGSLEALGLKFQL